MLETIYFFIALFNLPELALPLLLYFAFFFYHNPPKEFSAKELALPALFLLIGFTLHSPEDLSTALLLSAFVALKATAHALRG